MKIPATWERTFEFACHDKSCAPPPAGHGGSSPSGHGSGVTSTEGWTKSAGVLLPPYGMRVGDRHNDVEHGPTKVVGIHGRKYKIQDESGKTHEYDADDLYKRRAVEKRPEPKRVWRTEPKTTGSDDGYDAMKDAGYNSRYYNTTRPSRRRYR